jgi:ribosomal-protein-alanine N-acetyltransferase
MGKDGGNPVLDVAGEADTAALAALHAKSLPPGWSEATFRTTLAAQHITTFVMRRGDGLCGLCVVQALVGEAEVQTIAVDPAAKRQGIGRTLLEAAIKHACDKEAKWLYLEVAEGNFPARSLYESARFELFGRRKHYYQSSRTTPEDALVMRLDLSPCIPAGVDLKSRCA